MRDTRVVMGMPVTVEILEQNVTASILNKVFDYFVYVDEKFSTYKDNSEIGLINQGKIQLKDYSLDMRTILNLANQTKRETDGYFDIYRKGQIDPSGVVKGWAIWQASQILQKLGVHNFYIDAGSDIQTSGKKLNNKPWTIGIKNPFQQDQIIKILQLEGEGVATSGNYIRGSHIYNPLGSLDESVVSLTVIGPNVLEADRFATAAFAMGQKGIEFIEKLAGLEGYLVQKDGKATYTSGFDQYVKYN